MEKEFASGAVIYRREQGLPLFLLVYSGRNRIWGFPKGHIETGEDEKTAACREIEEESGIIRLTFIDGFREEMIYPTVSNRPPYRGRTIEKHSIYFLCETPQQETRVDGREITSARWLRFEEAVELLPFDPLKGLLRKAGVFLRIDNGSDR
jgi:8-oxo-dGTP pyrophosphatase MutT (NUDIX family)